MIEQYSALLKIMLAAYCIGSITLLFSPLLAIAAFIFFRASTAVAAYAHVTVPGDIQFFLPALLILVFQAIVSSVYSQVRFQVNRVFGGYIAFLTFITVVATIFVATGTSPAKAVEEISKCTFPIFAYVMVYVGIKQESDLSKIMRYIAWGSLIPIVAGIVEMIFGQGYDFVTDAFTPKDFRPAGTIIDPNLYGIYLSLCLFLALPNYLIEKNRWKTFYVLLLLFTIIIAQNRGTWIALAIAFALALPLFKRHLHVRNWVIGAVLVCLLSAPILVARFNQLNEYDQYGQKQNTAAGRLEYSTLIFKMALDSPIYGNGPYSFEKADVEGGFGEILPPHNDYVRIACEYGFPILLIYIYFLFSQIIWTIKHRTDRLWQYQFAACAGQIYICIISIAQNVLTDTISYMLFFCLMAISHRASFLSQAEEAHQGSDLTDLHTKPT